MDIRNAFTALALASIGAFAELPTTMLFQGNMTVDGKAQTGATKLVVALYDADTKGTKVWEESFASVSMVNGAFAVQLGATQALPAFDKPLYVQLSADGKAAATRVPLTLAPYAVMAGAIPNVRSSGDTTFLDASTVSLGAEGTIMAKADYGSTSRSSSIKAKVTESGSLLDLEARSGKPSTGSYVGGLRLTDTLTTLYSRVKPSMGEQVSSIYLNPWDIQIAVDSLFLTRETSVLVTPVLKLNHSFGNGPNPTNPIPECNATTAGMIFYDQGYAGSSTCFRGCVYNGPGNTPAYSWAILNNK